QFLAYIRVPAINVETLMNLGAGVLRRLLGHLHLQVAGRITVKLLPLAGVSHRSLNVDLSPHRLPYRRTSCKGGRSDGCCVLRIVRHVIGLHLLVNGDGALEVALPKRYWTSARPRTHLSCAGTFDGSIGCGNDI